MATLLLLATGVTAGPLLEATSMQQLLQMRQTATDYLTKGTMDEQGNLVLETAGRSLQSKGPTCFSYETESDCNACHVQGTPCAWDATSGCIEASCGLLTTETDCTAGYADASHFPCKWLPDFGDSGTGQCNFDSCAGLAEADCAGVVIGESWNEYAHGDASTGFFYCAYASGACTATLCTRPDASSDFDAGCGITTVSSCSDVTSESDCIISMQVNTWGASGCRWAAEYTGEAKSCIEMTVDNLATQPYHKEVTVTGTGAFNSQECSKMQSDQVTFAFDYPDCQNFVDSSQNPALCTPGATPDAMFTACSECRTPVCDFMSTSDACLEKKAGEDAAADLTDLQKYGAGAHCQAGNAGPVQEACSYAGLAVLGMLAALRS